MGLSLSLAVFSQVTQFMPLSPALLSISPTYPLAGRFSRLHSHIIYFMGKTIFLWTGQSQCAEIVKQKERSVSGRRVIAQNPKSNALINQQKVINPASSSFSPFKPVHISYYDFNRLCFRDYACYRSTICKGYFIWYFLCMLCLYHIWYYLFTTS